MLSNKWFILLIVSGYFIRNLQLIGNCRVWYFFIMLFTVFDLIIAGDTMQNLKLRVDFYYS